MTSATLPSPTTVDTAGHEWESGIGNNEPRDKLVDLARVSVLSWEGGMLRIRQKIMAVGHPYAFVLDGVPVVAIKRRSGNVDFYQVPTK